MAKKKYYVVWKGHETGVFSTWNECKKHITNFKGAQYKSFASEEEAKIAYTKSYEEYVGKDTKRVKLSEAELKKFGKPILNSLSVDAACSGNP